MIQLKKHVELSSVKEFKCVVYQKEKFKSMSYDNTSGATCVMTHDCKKNS